MYSNPSEEITMESKNKEKEAGLEQRSKVPSFDEYFRMNEQEKDLAIERSILRLENRFRQILYLMEIERNPSIAPKPARTQLNDHPHSKV